MAQGQDLGLVSEETSSIVNNALADCTKIPDLAVVEIGKELSQAADVRLLPLLVVVISGPELQQDLIVY